MTGGLLDFFTLEASEYVEQLDALVSRASSKAPDPDSFGRTLRALRGSATMAKVTGIADLATALERLARRVRDGDLAWDAATRGIAVASIDDAKILIRAVRSWGPDEGTRVAERVAEIDRVAPKRISAAAPKSGSEYLAAAAADAAAGLLEYAENPGGEAQFERVMDKVRALRGVAALKDLPPLNEVVDAVDAAAKPIELKQEDATSERRRLFRTAARVLLEGGDAVRNGGLPPTDSVALREFAHASSTLGGGSARGDDVVPIADLLAHGEDTIQAASHPPTTSAERFRLEVVSQAEHLRRLVDDGRTATDAATRDRLSRELRGAVRALARAGRSFGADEIADLFLAAERGAAALEPQTLDVLDRGAQLLSGRDATGPAELTPEFVALTASLGTEVRSSTPAPTAAASASDEHATIPATPSADSQIRVPAATPKPGAVTIPPTPAFGTAAIGGARAPSGAALRDLLSVGISGLTPLGNERFAEPLVGDEDDVIPIDELVFRGKEALARAIAIGDALRQQETPPDQQTLAELYDLLQLAAAE